jgi:cytidylate kinase
MTVPEAAHGTTQNVVPFITISRQAGMGARSFAKLLAERLNEVDPAERPWKSWENELVEKAALDHQLSAQLVSALEDSSHTWLDEFLAGLPRWSDSEPSETEVLHGVKETIRGLAEKGRLIMVGCGAGYITHDMPGGLHLRLVGRLEDRVKSYSRQAGLEKEAAAAEVERLDENRLAFFKKHWPDRPLRAEQFHLTLNSSLLGEEEMVAVVVALVMAKTKAAGAR